MPTTLVTALTTEALATRLADALMEGEHHLPVVAAGAFEQAPPDWRFEAWFENAPDLGDFTLTVRRLMGADADAFAFEHRLVDETDWVAKSLEDLPPVRAGRFVVHGAHDAHKVRGNELGLRIEASMAFGTGHHGTTLGCLLEIDRWARRRAANRRKGPRRDARPLVLDVGTGTGVLAIAVARALKARGVAGDLDMEAVRIACENVAIAGVRVAVVPAIGTRHPVMRASAPYPLVVANILAGPLVAIAGELTAMTEPGGTLILSGLLTWQARRVTGAYLARGFRVERRRIIGDWATLVLVRAHGAHLLPLGEGVAKRRMRVS